jgi:protein-tyrosine phosphatase
VDVADGLLLALFAFYLFRESGGRLPVVRNGRVGSYYALGTAAVLVLVPVMWPWGVFLLWPAAGLGIVAAAYFGLGPGIFRKTAGRLPLSTRLVLAPVLIGQYVSLVYYRRKCRAWDEVAPGVLIGRCLTEAEAATAVQQGVTAVPDLTAEFSEAAPFRTNTYRNIPILDLTRPTQDQLMEAVRFLTEESAKGTVYVHCKIGYSRSAAVAGAYLLASEQAATVEEAVARLRRARPTIVIRPEAMEALREFAEREAACGSALLSAAEEAPLV